MNKENHTHHFYLFTDGACQNNPGPGGWGFVLLDPSEKAVEIGGFESLTTNNQMELTAICEGLDFVLKNKHGSSELHVYTDSKYAVEGINKWIRGWVRNDWKTTSGKDVQNKALWQRFLTLMTDQKLERKVVLHHVPSHVGLVLNERVDKIATTCAERKKNYFYEKIFSDYPHSAALNTLEQDIVKAKGIKSKMTSGKNKKAYSYVSLVEGEVRVHKTWKECESHVKGASFARFKKALTKEEEEEIIESFKRP